MKRFTGRLDIIFLFCVFLLAVAAEHHELLSVFENRTITLRHGLRTRFADPAVTGFPVDKIAFVTIDDHFFEEYNGYPLRRTDVAGIIANLKELGAMVIGLSRVFDFPNSYGEDPFLAATLREAGNVVLASHAVFRDHRFDTMTYPVSPLREACRSGYANISSSSTAESLLSRVRIYPEITREENGWPFAVEVLAGYLGVRPRLDGQVLTVGDFTVELSHLNDLYIDFPGLPGGFQYANQLAGVSALDLLDTSDLDEDDLLDLRDFIAGKIVLIGDTTKVSNDVYITPAGRVFGIEIIAATIKTLLHNGPLRPAPRWQEILSTLIFLVVVFFASSRVLEPWVRVLATILAFACFSVLGAALYVYQGIILSMSYTMIAGILAYTAVSLQSFVDERRLRSEMEAKGEFIRNTFGRYLSDDIVQKLLDTPGGLHLGGEKKLLTIMMTDLRGFTAISERLPPESVVTIINNYLEEMTHIIVKYNGTIDEFIGDAILVIFGAPISREDDTQRAVACAIEMQLAMVRVNARNREMGLPEVVQGIGLNTGEVVVGNIGSEIRSKYGVVGRNVNLTARIESYTTGGQVFISERTRDEVGDILRIDSDFQVSPKGVSHPITISEVGGIGGRFNLYLPEKSPVPLVALAREVALEIFELAGKDVDAATIRGAIIKLDCDVHIAEISSVREFAKLTNLRVTLFDQEGKVVSRDLYAKVVDCCGTDRVLLNFTALPPEAERYLKEILALAGG